ncbi:hypothetical protein GGF38_005033, partial [Coemansia sp. RSA 25]
VCEDCDDYEDISVNAFKDTVGQAKAAIATQLGIEADEFVFEYKCSNSNKEPEDDALISELYLSTYDEQCLHAGEEVEPYNVTIYENWDYKGKTGMLAWILKQKHEAYCNQNDLVGSQLAKRLAVHIKAFKAQFNVPPTTAAPGGNSCVAKK